MPTNQRKKEQNKYSNFQILSTNREYLKNGKKVTKYYYALKTLELLVLRINVFHFVCVCSVRSVQFKDHTSLVFIRVFLFNSFAPVYCGYENWVWNPKVKREKDVKKSGKEEHDVDNDVDG